MDPDTGKIGFYEEIVACPSPSASGRFLAVVGQRAMGIVAMAQMHTRSQPYDTGQLGGRRWSLDESRLMRGKESRRFTHVD